MSSAVTNLWRQFVQRRLWPVAILMVAALAAVPLVLAEEPTPSEPASPPVAASAEVTDVLASEPIVALAEARTTRRKVLGKAKNPFAAAKPNSGPSKTDSSTVVTVAKTPKASGDDPGKGSGGDTGTGGSSTPSSGTTTPSAPVAPTTPAAPQPKPKTYAPQELTVRFGADENKRQSLKRLQALPSEDNPVLIYMGLLKDGKTAEFMVGDGVSPVGDGECRPSPEECEIVRLRAGETEFFDVKDETGNVTDQFQLDLLKVHRPGGASASKAKASVKAAASMLQSGSGLRAAVGQSIARLP